MLVKLGVISITKKYSLKQSEFIKKFIHLEHLTSYVRINNILFEMLFEKDNYFFILRFNLFVHLYN
jgi:hypothetical protein